MDLKFGNLYKCRNGFVGELIECKYRFGKLKGAPIDIEYDPNDKNTGHLIFPISRIEHEYDIVEEVVDEPKIQLTLTEKEAAILYNLLYCNVIGYDGVGGHRDTLNDISEHLEKAGVSKGGNKYRKVLPRDKMADFG